MSISRTYEKPYSIRPQCYNCGASLRGNTTETDDDRCGTACGNCGAVVDVW
jgi:hypothetical protein